MDARTWFDAARRGFTALLPGLHDWLDAPGLGGWDVRSLLGHTTRAFLTLESYLPAEVDQPIEHPAEDHPTLTSAVAYFHASAQGLSDPAAVLDRGVRAGSALGENPLSSSRDIAHRVGALVARTPDEAPVTTPVGRMRLIDYLPTRAFELTVHSIDLARASHQAIPPEFVVPTQEAVSLAAALASFEDRLSLLLAATGRDTLQPGFTVL